MTHYAYILLYFFLLGTRGPLTLGGPLDFAYPAYPIVTPLAVSHRSSARALSAAAAAAAAPNYDYISRSLTLRHFSYDAAGL